MYLLNIIYLFIGTALVGAKWIGIPRAGETGAFEEAAPTERP